MRTIQLSVCGGLVAVSLGVRVLGSTIFSSPPYATIIPNELSSKCKNLLLDPAQKVDFWTLRTQETVTEEQLARVKEAADCAEAITRSFISNSRQLDNVSYNQFIKEFYEIMRNTNIEPYFRSIKEFGSSSTLTNLARLKLDPLALRFFACWGLWNLACSEEDLCCDDDDSQERIVGECAYSLQSLWVTSDYFKRLHELLRPELDLQRQAVLVDQVITTLSELYARYEEELCSYLEKHGVLFRKASATAYGQREARLLLSEADWSLGFMGRVQVGHKDASHLIPKPETDFLAHFSPHHQQLINQHVERSAQHAFDVFWPKVNQFVCEHATLSIIYPPQLRAFPPALITVQGQFVCIKNQMTGFNKDQKATFDAIVARLSSVPVQIDLSHYNTSKDAFSTVIEELDIQSALIGFVCHKHYPQCFNTNFAQAIVGLHGAYSNLADIINHFVDSFKEKAQCPKLRFSLGCHLYSLLIPMSMKLAAFDKAFRDYVESHSALSLEDQSLITPYDRDAVEALLKGPPVIQVSIPFLFKDHSDNPPPLAIAPEQGPEPMFQ